MRHGDLRVQMSTAYPTGRTDAECNGKAPGPSDRVVITESRPAGDDLGDNPVADEDDDERPDELGSEPDGKTPGSKEGEDRYLRCHDSSAQRSERSTARCQRRYFASRSS